MGNLSERLVDMSDFYLERRKATLLNAENMIKMSMLLSYTNWLMSLMRNNYRKLGAWTGRMK
jgi:hypothetical protein